MKKSLLLLSIILLIGASVACGRTNESAQDTRIDIVIEDEEDDLWITVSYDLLEFEVQKDWEHYAWEAMAELLGIPYDPDEDNSEEAYFLTPPSWNIPDPEATFLSVMKTSYTNISDRIEALDFLATNGTEFTQNELPAFEYTMSNPHSEEGLLYHLFIEKEQSVYGFDFVYPDNESKDYDVIYEHVKHSIA